MYECLVCRAGGGAARLPQHRATVVLGLYDVRDLLGREDPAFADRVARYFEYCRDNEIEIHPARFPQQLPEYFIKFLTKPGGLVVDPFAGSCNGLFWILRSVTNSKGLGFEMDQTIFEMTKRNISFLDRPIELLHGDYKALLDTHRFPSDNFIIAFLAPPWGDALNETTGLDLGRTKPPIADIIDDFERIYKDNRILYVTQVHQNIEPFSLANLKKKFGWSDLRIYDINVEGMRHGILLGLNRWTPQRGVVQ